MKDTEKTLEALKALHQVQACRAEVMDSSRILHLLPSRDSLEDLVEAWFWKLAAPAVLGMLVLFFGMPDAGLDILQPETISYLSDTAMQTDLGLEWQVSDEAL